MEMTHDKTRRLVLGALMAALVFVGSWARITLPIAIAGNTAFHLGNIMCALSGILLGPVGGGLASAVGSALFDMTNPLYLSECWITFLTKGLYGVVAGLIAWSGGRRGESLPRNAAATVAAAVAYAVVYLAKSFFYNGLLVDGLTAQAAALTVVAKLPATIFNAVVAIVCAPLLAKAIERALKRAGLRSDPAA